jgi:hypothetical protein
MTEVRHLIDDSGARSSHCLRSWDTGGASLSHAKQPCDLRKRTRLRRPRKTQDENATGKEAPHSLVTVMPAFSSSSPLTQDPSDVIVLALTVDFSVDGSIVLKNTRIS